jgi:hypothetical protein
VQPERSTAVWWMLGSIAAVLGAIYGWHAAERYGPPVVAALGMAVVGGGAAGWLFRASAEQNEAAHGRLAVGALASLVLLLSISIVAGADATATSLFAFLGLVGGIGIAIHPWLAFWAALIGIAIGALDAAIPPLRPDSVRGLTDGIWLAIKAGAAFGLLAPTALAANEKRSGSS